MNLTIFSKLLLISISLYMLYNFVYNVDKDSFKDKINNHIKNSNWTYEGYVRNGDFLDCHEGYVPHIVKLKNLQTKETKNACFCNGIISSYINIY